MRKDFLVGVSVVFIGATTLAHCEDEYMGAEALIQQVSDDAKSESKGDDPGAELLAKIKDLAEKPKDLLHSEAAALWVDLFESYYAIPPRIRNNLNQSKPPLTLANVFAALPTPEAWNEISKEIGSLPDSKNKLLKESLRLTSSILTEDLESQQGAIERLKKAYLESKKTDSYAAQYVDNYFQRIETALEAQEGTLTGLLEKFKSDLDKVDEKMKGSDFDIKEHYMSVPRLTETISDKEAEAVILRIIKLEAQFDCSHAPTKRLIARVMMENPDAIAAPFWDVIETPAEIPLFEILSEKISKKDRWDFTDAESNYVSSLIKKKQFDKAKTYVRAKTKKESRRIGINLGDIDKIKDVDFLKEVTVFFETLLKEDAAYPYWSDYFEFASKAGKPEKALEEIKASIDAAQEGTDFTNDQRALYLNGLLEMEKVDEALAYLRETVSKLGAEGIVSSDRQASDYLRNCIQLARMAKLLEKPALVDEAFDSASKAAKLIHKYGSSGYQNQLITELVKQGRGPSAEKLIAEELVFISRKNANGRSNRDGALTSLCYVYSEAGRHQDVIDLLEKSKMWDAGDLSELSGNRFANKPLMLLAAESLHAVGRNEEAMKLVDRVLANNPGLDAAYELLLALGGDKILEKLDRLHAENRFQERPLIWKAKYLFEAGKLDEAESIAKAAIAIDPSDGEQGKGDRMRVYAVLAEIMEKKGDAEQAEFLKAVVRSIRKSEEGDDWWSAGMRKRAITIYEESLKEFADAYCIQSRLALRYSEMGDFKKAEEHYRRAFELMPGSFGRVESHCFGCEGAFSGEKAQGIADKVFLKLAEEMPEKPQVFYLLGYLRNQQDRNIEALEYFKKAVKLDPEYINAWKKMQRLAGDTWLSVHEKDQISLNLARLDPHGNHLSQVLDLKKLWSAALDADKNYIPAETGPVFALKQSSSPRNNYRSSYREKTPPRMQIASNAVVRELIQLFGYIWSD